MQVIDMDEILKQLGNEIRAARKDRNLTQQQLADHTGHGLRHIQRIEMGKVNPTFEMLYVLIHELGISADALFFPDLTDSEKEMRHLQAKLNACTEEERQIIIQTMDYLASQFLIQHQTQQAKKEEEKELTGAGV